MALQLVDLLDHRHMRERAWFDAEETPCALARREKKRRNFRSRMNIFFAEFILPAKADGSPSTDELVVLKRSQLELSNHADQVPFFFACQEALPINEAFGKRRRWIEQM